MNAPQSRFAKDTKTCWILIERYETHMKVKDWLYGAYESYDDAVAAKHKIDVPGDLEIIETFFVDRRNPKFETSQNRF